MVRKQVDQRTSDLGAQVTSTSEDLRHIGEKLRDEDQDTPAQLADKAAEQAKRVGRYLNDADADTLIADVEDLGRRQPMLVLAGGVVLGIAAARFLKASSSRRYEQSAGNGSSSQAQQLPSGPSVSDYAATTSRAVRRCLPLSARSRQRRRCQRIPRSGRERDGTQRSRRPAAARPLDRRARRGALAADLQSDQTGDRAREGRTTDTGKNAGKGAGMIGGAGAIGYLAAAALTTAIIALLDKAMDTWIAALIVAVVYAAIAGVLALRGRDEVKAALPPTEQTVETIKEDVQWAKTQARSVRK